MFGFQTTRRLHEEHEATLALLGRFEQALQGRGRPSAAARPDTAWMTLARDLVQALEQEIDAHFTFEETQLFPRLEDAGEGDIAALLREEHEVIREVVRSLLPQLRNVAAGDAAQSDVAKGPGLELVERLVAHIQKEEMALLPALESALDEQTDGELMMIGGEQR
jgi:hemerythrin-like domain-containing protein